MKFAEPLWLVGALFALVVAALFVGGAFRLSKVSLRFGDAERIRDLVTSHPATARAWKAVFVVVATAAAFVALARPQYGRGTRLIPATNLDVVIVLDYSKSMYARDISPSRIARAKAEVARLIHDLAGARFGAVAFSGEPIAFPLSSDGAAIAQFFRQLEPNDMPVRGTAIARALERARELLARDPKAREHSRTIVLVTDGEDLEGDPVAVAREAANDKIAIHVVQIGGRTPERIPEIGPNGQVLGYRKDEEGKPLTTSLSAEGEAQLAEIASATGGNVIRSERGSTGIDTVARDLRRKMTQELAERVETIYADVYMYPLAFAILLLVAEAFWPEARRRWKVAAAARLLSLMVLALGAPLATSGCHWNPSRPFEREAPQVSKAVLELDAGDASVAASLLEDYLSTGPCSAGGFGTPKKVTDRPFASYDLGLALFRIGERYGKRFGDEEVGRTNPNPSPEEQQLAELRATEVDCALRVVLAIAIESATPLDLRARARYLAGNLEFLRRSYEEAVRQYDEALKLAPGMHDAGDSVGRDAAHNRAIALERIEDEKKRDSGAPDSGPQDGGKPNQDASPNQGDSGKNDPHDKDAQSKQNPSPDAGTPPDPSPPDAAPPPPPPSPDAGDKPEPPPPNQPNQDDKILDSFEAVPSFQQEDAKKRAAGRRGRGMPDK